MEPLRIVSALAFQRSVDDVLAVAGEAMSRIWNNQAQMLWRFTQEKTPVFPAGNGAYFNAMAVYTRNYEDIFSGMRKQSTESVRLTMTASPLPTNRAYTSFTFDFTDSSYAQTPFETIAIVTCFYVTNRLLELQWLAGDQAPGFWRLANRNWSSPIIVKALSGGQYDIPAFVVSLQQYGLFAALNPNTGNEAIWVRQLFQP